MSSPTPPSPTHVPPESPSLLPEPPEPLTPAQVRARRVQQLARIRAGQEAGLLPSPAPAPLPAGTGPATKRITLKAIAAQRIPVDVSDAAREVIISSSSEGRLLPQALSEFLGAHRDELGGVERVSLDVLPKSALFAVHPDERDPATGEEPLLLRIAVVHTSGDADLAHAWLINAATLADLHPVTRQPLFTAETAAREFLRLYQEHAQQAMQAMQAMQATATDTVQQGA